MSYTIENNMTWVDRNKATLYEEQVKYEQRAANILDKQNNAYIRNKAFTEFKEDAKNYLVCQGIYSLLEKCIDNTSTQSGIAKRLVESFVLEEGADNLLSKWSTKSIYLASLSNIIKESYSDIIESVKEDDSKSFTIKPTDKNNFYEKLEGLSVTRVVDKINDNVTRATKEFVDSYIEDKMKMEKMAQELADKLDNAKKINPDAEEEIKQEHVNMYKYYNESLINKRSRNILEEMVRRVSNKVITENGAIMESYRDNGKPKMKEIIDSVTTMYTFLEMVSVAKLKDINESYIQNVLDSIK